jgi:hypothetical protein
MQLGLVNLLAGTAHCPMGFQRQEGRLQADGSITVNYPDESNLGFYGLTDLVEGAQYAVLYPVAMAAEDTVFASFDGAGPSHGGSGLAIDIFTAASSTPGLSFRATGGGGVDRIGPVELREVIAA